MAVIKNLNQPRVSGINMDKLLIETNKHLAKKYNEELSADAYSQTWDIIIYLRGRGILHEDTEVKVVKEDVEETTYLVGKNKRI